jgi:hypothetical protein
MQLKQTTVLWTTTAALGIAALAAPGCQRYVNVPRGATNDAPVPIDEAMQIRDWEPSSARYTNPRFIAGPTGYWFQPSYGMPEPVYAVQEAPMFVLQTLGLPVTVWFPPLWTPVEYAGETLEPTWHAMPPLPEAHPDQPPAPPEVTEPATEPPPPPPPVPAEPGAAPPPADDPMPQVYPTQSGAVMPPDSPHIVTTPAPAAQPTPAPMVRSSTATPVRPATQPTVTYTPSAVAPTRTTPATQPITLPARDMNK